MVLVTCERGRQCSTPRLRSMRTLSDIDAMCKPCSKVCLVASDHPSDRGDLCGSAGQCAAPGQVAAEDMGTSNTCSEFEGIVFDACSLSVNEADRCGFACSGRIVPILVPYLKKNDEAIAGCMGSHVRGASCDATGQIAGPGNHEQGQLNSVSRQTVGGELHPRPVARFPVREFIDVAMVSELISSLGLTDDDVACMPPGVYSQLQIVAGWSLRHFLFTGDDHGGGYDEDRPHEPVGAEPKAANLLTQ